MNFHKFSENFLLKIKTIFAQSPHINKKPKRNLKVYFLELSSEHVEKNIENFSIKLCWRSENVSFKVRMKVKTISSKKLFFIKVSSERLESSSADFAENVLLKSQNIFAQNINKKPWKKRKVYLFKMFSEQVKKFLTGFV